ncbi:histidine phosphatase family protein [soil metagenome]
MRLLLIRHGQTPANVAGSLDTATPGPGPGLTDLGTLQAGEIPRALAADRIDGIFASRLVRTQLTAAPLALDRDLGVQVLPGLHEIEAGSLEGRTDREAIHSYLETAFAWGLGDLDPAMPGGPDGHEFFARFDRDIATVARELAGGTLNADPEIAAAATRGKTAVVFSHGAAIRVWVAGRATNVPPSYSGEHDIQNTGVIELEGTPAAGWTLLSWQGTPVGGIDLVDPTAEDPTGETLAEAEIDEAE